MTATQQLVKAAAALATLAEWVVGSGAVDCHGDIGPRERVEAGLRTKAAAVRRAIARAEGKEGGAQ